MTSSDEHVDVAALAHQGGAGVVSVEDSEAGGSSEAERIPQLHDAWGRGGCQSAGVDLLEPEGRCSSEGRLLVLLNLPLSVLISGEDVDKTRGSGLELSRNEPCSVSSHKLQIFSQLIIMK